MWLGKGAASVECVAPVHARGQRQEKGAELQPALATSVGCAPTALMVCSKQLFMYGT